MKFRPRLSRRTARSVSVAPAPADAAAAAPAAHIYSNGEIRLLVLDDDPAIGRLIQAALAGHEFHIDVVSEPALMTKALEEWHYQLVILDYVLPGLDPTEVMEAIRVHQADAGVIVITGHPSVDSALNCLRNRTYDYLTKPFEVEQLKKAVLKCLEARGLLRLSEDALREQLGAAIRERRKALGMTLAEVAQRTDLSLGYMSQIELGKNSASVETLYRMALALRIRLADLFQAVQPY